MATAAAATTTKIAIEVVTSTTAGITSKVVEISTTASTKWQHKIVTQK